MKKQDGKDELFTPEFVEWLKGKQISRKRLKKDPTALDLYYREWMKTKKRSRPGKLSIFQRIPTINIDLGSVVDNVRIASEILKAFQETKESQTQKNNETA